MAFAGEFAETEYVQPANLNMEIPARPSMAVTPAQVFCEVRLPNGSRALCDVSPGTSRGIHCACEDTNGHRYFGIKVERIPRH